MRPNISLGDSLAGLHAAFGVALALLERLRPDGRGQVIDASITESMFNMLEAATTEFAYSGADREPSGSTISGVVPTGTFRTADGRWAVVGGNGESVYGRLMAAVGRPDLGPDAPSGRYSSNALRCEPEVAAEIMDALAAWVAARPLAEVSLSLTAWRMAPAFAPGIDGRGTDPGRRRAGRQVLEALRAARVPAGPVRSPGELLADEQLRARGMFDVGVSPPPLAGGRPGYAAEETFTLPAMAPVLSGTPGRTRWAGPQLGQHTEEILRGELGLGPQELARLRLDKVIA